MISLGSDLIDSCNSRNCLYVSLESSELRNVNFEVFGLWLLGFLSAKVAFLLQFRPKLAQLIFPDDKRPQFHNSSNFSSCYFPFLLKLQFVHQDSRMIICNICNRNWELIHRVCMLVIFITIKLGSET